MKSLREQASRASADALLALAFAFGSAGAALRWPGDRPTDGLGIALLMTGNLLVAFRRWRAGLTLVAVIAVILPYHILGYRHEAAVPGALLALGSFAAEVRRTKALLVGLGLAVIGLSSMIYIQDGRIDAGHLGAAGWIFASAVAGQAWRANKNYVGSIIDRAERAERTREEEALRRVAEERVRIARDLHDVLAHSITLIGVQAGVAAHLARQPQPEGPVLADALETIADSCRAAREEVRATLRVLRDEGEEPEHGAVPGLSGLADLADAVRATGLEVELGLRVEPGEVGPAVGVAAYRIVQEALTNVVRHAKAERVRVDAVREGGMLRLTVVDDGVGALAGRGEAADGPGGFGILGMSERARSVGGMVSAWPGEDGGFRVEAWLPVGDAEPEEGAVPRVGRGGAVPPSRPGAATAPVSSRDPEVR
ncbi:MAG: sensor histidine kinase [Streptomycetaceae bacterium]|nr:sensor histidine kinase [Streptomycetaceae bacterium]